MPTNYAAMSNAEIDRMIAERLEPKPTDSDDWQTGRSQNGIWDWGKLDELDFKYQWLPLPFSTSHDAAHAAWMRLTEEQKKDVAFNVPVRRSIYYEVGFRNALDATPRQLCEWMLEALDGSSEIDEPSEHEASNWGGDDFGDA